MPDIQKILHPTDFSELSRPAFQTACALARDSHATLLVLHVMVPSSSPLMQGPPPDPMQPIETQGTIAQLPWPEPSDPTIRVEHRLAEGDPADEILRFAGAGLCDLVVMGSHGRAGLGRFLTGSVAEEVLRKAVCPVLVVKTPLRSSPDTKAESTANPGCLIDVRPLGTSLVSSHTRTLVHTSTVEVVRLIVREGQEVSHDKNTGEIIVQCLEGRVILTALGKPQVLEAGRLVELPAGEHYGLRGIEDSSLLLTILSPSN